MFDADYCLVLLFLWYRTRMQIKRIEKTTTPWFDVPRPTRLDAFVWQENIKRIVHKAIISAQKRKAALWHILFAWNSGFGKTTLASIVAKELPAELHIVTGYALTKPADIISLLTHIGEYDVLFIDEIHRLKPNLEEMLYTAMEDFAIDMVMPDGWNIRMPLKQFTLIWATTKMESLSEPLKNRFIYKFHFTHYTIPEKHAIVQRYLTQYVVDYDMLLIENIANKVDAVPREIHNLCIQIRDFLVSHNQKRLTDSVWEECAIWLDIDDGWITPLHKQYLDILLSHNRAVWLKTIALQLGIHEDSVEKDVEPLLLKLWKIEKTWKWRKMVE